MHPLTHWGRVTHICVSKIIIIGSDNGLSPDRRQAIIWTNAGILLIGPWGTNFSEISIGIQTFLFKKMHVKMSSAKWRPFCLGLSVLIIRVILVYDNSILLVGVVQQSYMFQTNVSRFPSFSIFMDKGLFCTSLCGDFVLVNNVFLCVYSSCLIAVADFTSIMAASQEYFIDSSG